MFESSVSGYITLNGDIDIRLLANERKDSNILVIDGDLTIYGTDEHLRKIALAITDHLDQREEKESEGSECTAYRKQAG